MHKKRLNKIQEIKKVSFRPKEDEVSDAVLHSKSRSYQFYLTGNKADYIFY